MDSSLSPSFVISARCRTPRIAQLDFLPFTLPASSPSTSSSPRRASSLLPAWSWAACMHSLRCFEEDCATRAPPRVWLRPLDRAKPSPVGRPPPASSTLSPTRPCAGLVRADLRLAISSCCPCPPAPGALFRRFNWPLCLRPGWGAPRLASIVLARRHCGSKRGSARDTDP